MSWNLKIPSRDLVISRLCVIKSQLSSAVLHKRGKRGVCLYKNIYLLTKQRHLPIDSVISWNTYDHFVFCNENMFSHFFIFYYLFGEKSHMLYNVYIFKHSLFSSFQNSHVLTFLNEKISILL